MLKNKFICLLVGFSFVGFSAHLIAKPVHVAINLSKITAIKTSDRSGDKLYFSITEYFNDAEPRLRRVPMFPLHWLSKDLPKHQQSKIWEGTIADNERVLLIFSLIEQDLAPFDPDEHIGSVQVKLVNRNGKINAMWGQPHFKDQPKVDQLNIKSPGFMMYGAHSKYEVRFKLQQK